MALITSALHVSLRLVHKKTKQKGRLVQIRVFCILNKHKHCLIMSNLSDIFDRANHEVNQLANNVGTTIMRLLCR